MLVLTRDLKDSTLLIGDDIEIKVVNIKGNQVRLAITAPDDVNIVRTELLPPERQPEKIPESAEKNKPRLHETPSPGNSINRKTRSSRGRQGYREPRQLTPSYSRAQETEYAPKSEKSDKVPVISLKRRRRVAVVDEKDSQE